MRSQSLAEHLGRALAANRAARRREARRRRIGQVLWLVFILAATPAVLWLGDRREAGVAARAVEEYKAAHPECGR
jgi:hypothetical protein